MQRRAPSTVAAAAPGLTQDASSSTPTASSTTLRRKKRKGLLSSSRRSSSLWDDDGLFFVLVGAMGCGLALFLVALAVRLAHQWNWSAKLMHGSGRMAHVGDWNPHRKKAGHHHGAQHHNQNSWTRCSSFRRWQLRRTPFVESNLSFSRGAVPITPTCANTEANDMKSHNECNNQSSERKRMVWI